MDMEIVYNTRRERLRSYMRDECGGLQIALAERLGKSPASVSRFFNEKNRKRIGEELAREIEEKLRKTRYWLDGIDSSATGGQWPFASISLAELTDLSGDQIISIENIIRGCLDVVAPSDEPEPKKLKRPA